jgi:beta-galactosidase
MTRFFGIVLLINACWIFSCSTPELPEDKVAGVQHSVISLNGTWKITLEPPDKFWENSINAAQWADIQVPGECQMQGFSIKHDQPFVYRHKFWVPDDYAGKDIFLDFHGVYSNARVWVNGQFVRDHTGGFTRWEGNITKLVTPGDSATLTVEVTDRINDLSYGSGYAKHQIGGILRKVEVKALPKQHIKKLRLETDLDENFRDADLKVFFELNRETPTKIRIELTDQQNRLVKKAEQLTTLRNGFLNLKIINPLLWDAEHPNLYKLTATLLENGAEIMKTTKNIGFREVAIDGNKLLVNGQPVKLRGACRHDIHPLLGRMTTPELDLQDVLLAKEANMNFIRTSHYPPSEAFLDYCDQYGIYVEDETAVCFVGSHRMNAYRASGATQNDSLFSGIYLSQLNEQVTNHRNHPCVIIWSIGNENVFGENFVKSYQWVKENDTTRPVIYSYPGQVPDSLKMYDILSMHYPDWRGNLKQYGIAINGFSHPEMPVLFDEWAHVACYNNDELKTDPNVRNFWGQSLDSMWTNVFNADGGLGGAIWCMIDETFMLPEDLPGFNQWWGIIDPNIIPSAYVGPCVGYGEWGIVDTWRRKKPEFWNTKKAYSPAKIYLNEISSYTSGADLKIPVHNRFDHTNFNELKITWEYGNKSGIIGKTDLKPHNKGEIVIPGQDWEIEKKLNLAFYQNDTFLVDNYSLQLGKKTVELPVPGKGELKAEETEEQVRLFRGDVEYSISKKTGLFENISIKGKTMVTSGPWINLKIPGRGADKIYRIQDYARNWKCSDFDYKLKDGIATFRIKGAYDSIDVNFTMVIGGNDVIQIDFVTEGLPANKSLQEFGLYFITADFSKLSWRRDAYFTGYPEGYLGSPEGEIDLTNKPLTKYREKPDHAWALDAQNFYYHGLDTLLAYPNIVRSMKENIRIFTLTNDKGSAITVLSEGMQAARFDKINGENTLIINEKWDYPELDWGNYMKNLKTTQGMEGIAIIKLNY